MQPFVLSSSAGLNPDGLILDEGYQQTMDSVVLPALAACQREVYLTGVGDARLACAVFEADQPVATVLVVHGFTENYFKYSELIHSLLANHCSVVAYDQRGHGNSWRKPGLEDVGDTHVDRFSDYVDDLNTVCEQLLSTMPRPWMIFSHSMGGAVTALFLEQHPDVFSRAVFCAPMIAPNLSGTPYPVAAALCHSEIALGHGAKRVFFGKPYHGPEDFNTSCASDPVRFAWYDAVKAAHPEYQNSSPTYGWVLEAMHVTKTILAPGAPEKISIPVLLYTADEDNSVMPDPQKEFISRIPGGRHSFVPGSRHEIFRSPDAVFFPWWHEILVFLKEQIQ